MKKTGESANVVDRAQSRAETRPGTVGVKVEILSPDAIMKDKIVINDELITQLKSNAQFKELPEVKTKARSRKK